MMYSLEILIANILIGKVLLGVRFSLSLSAVSCYKLRLIGEDKKDFDPKVVMVMVFLVLITVAFVQLFFSYLEKSIYAFILQIFLLTGSVRYLTPLLYFNMCMTLRICHFTYNEIYQGVLEIFIIALIILISGIVVSKYKDYY